MADSDERPLLIYDGDCDFCAYWVRYWARLTGPRVRYRPFQDSAPEYPQLSRRELAASIQWIGRDGRRCAGAEAAFRLLATVPQHGCWLWLYRNLPGYDRFSERCYGLIARHRTAAARVSGWLWGRERLPDDYGLVSWLFLRILALIYLAAFASLAVQIEGLAGSEGIIPVADFLARARADAGWSALWQLPTLFWFDASDFFLKAVCWLGIAAALALLFNAYVRTALALCYGFYLSLLYAGQGFMAFQWDLLLLESGFLALFLVSGSRIVVWLYRWLLFRFMFMGGVVKLASGDPAWRDLSAIFYHLETQPLPSPLAWYAHQLPEAFLQAATAAVLVIELVLPFLVFMPRRPRLLAAAGFLLLQGGIMLTGNFAFFNLLTLALCLFLLEDRDIRPLLGGERSARIRARLRAPGRADHARAGGMAVIIIVACGGLLWLTNTGKPMIQPLDGLVRLSNRLAIVNGYGPFAVMARERREIILEGSADRKIWLPYAFRYKPGDPQKPLGWNIPHQPRLDWQLWFQAQGYPSRSVWFPNLMERLRRGSRPVLSLLRNNPFPDQPPRYLRASLYRYRYSTPVERSITGQLWQREPVGRYP